MKYYFLVSFLPEIHWEERRLLMEATDLLEDMWYFASVDRSEIELILLGHDITILERLLAGREPFPGLSLYTADFWREQIKTPQEGPTFIREFLENRSTEEIQPQEAEQLAEGYYHYVLSISRSDFLRSYFYFEKDLKNILAAWRSRRLGRAEDTHLVGDGDTVDSLTRSKNEDFSLSRDHPWIEDLLTAENPGEIADTVDRVLWDWIEAHQSRDVFSFDTVLAYFMKLRLLERRMTRDPEAGSRKITAWEEM